MVDLGHDELGHEPRQRLRPPRQLVEVDRGCGRQTGHPVVAAAGLEEPAQAYQQCVGRVAGHPYGGEPRQVVLEHRSAQLPRRVDLGMLLGEEPREPAHRPNVDVDRRERLAGGQPEPGVTLDRFPQPLLGDVAELDLLGALEGTDPEDLGTPGVACELAVGVGASDEVGQLAVGVAQLADGP